MHGLTIFAALAAVGSAQAQSSSTLITSYASSASAAASSTSNTPVTHTVDVAKGGHSYAPDVIVAAVGDVVQFQFYPTNHSVIRMQYGYPCIPYEMMMPAGNPGFYSGQQPVDTVLADPPTWSLTINNTDPVFFYCGAINSCIGYQMVGAINPNASTSLEVQKQKAADSTFMLTPGMDWPDEGSIPSGAPTTSYSTPTASSSPASSSSAAASSSGSSGLSTGAIAGIAIGAAAVLVIAGVAIWFCGFHSRKHSPVPTTPAQETAYNPHHSMGPAMYAKPGHQSTVSGYSMPPGYADQPGMLSPAMQSATFHDPRSLHSGSVSPNFMNSAPAYGHGSMAEVYTPAHGTHNVVPVEMDSHGDHGRVGDGKIGGVERYS